ncbi:porin family protein [Bacteroidia bacterium]|nr:porin family protein [Bacteroidia bacterium]
MKKHICITKSRIFVVLFCMSSSYLTFAQKVGIQFYQGVNKPLVSFSGDNNALDYSSNFNSDTRLGVFFGDLKKISASALFGASAVKAVAMNEDIVTTFTNSSLRIDIPVRYAFPESFVSSVAVGPSVGLLMSSSQTINGIPIRSEELFTATNFYVGGEIDFIGYSSDKLNLYPYVSYRMMLNNADIDTDNLKINELSFGLRIDISK